jgi:hypothetical protein
MNNQLFRFFSTFSLCWILTTSTMIGMMSSTAYKADSFIVKPQFSQDYFVFAPYLFSSSYADNAFNEQGEKVSFLQQFGAQPLLQRFVDPSITNDDSIGKGLYSGQLHIQELNVSCIKNLTHGFFIQAGTVIQNTTIDTISINYTPSESPLSPEQINYLEQFYQLIPQKINRSGMLTSGIYTGYSTTLSNFTTIDFIDITTKLGITSPESMHEINHSNLQFPNNDNNHFGYPIIITTSLGLHDWITLGCHGSVTVWQDAMKYMPIDQNNNFFITTQDMAMISKKPRLTSGLYCEADHIFQGFSATLAYTYNTNFTTTIRPLHQEEYPFSYTYQPWSMGSMYLQADFDFATEITPNAPILKILYTFPIHGKLSSKTNSLCGSCTIQMSYNF